VGGGGGGWRDVAFLFQLLFLFHDAAGHRGRFSSESSIFIIGHYYIIVKLLSM